MREGSCSAASRYTHDMDQWNPTFAAARAPLLFLQEAAAGISGEGWPDLAVLQRLLDDAGVCVASGRPLRLVSPGGKAPYELRVYASGELECREHNWHDLFNVLVWLAFPQTKAALNARHHVAWAANPGAGRGAVRDALTLFDESGLAVLSAQPELLQLIRDFRWKRLFWEQRAAVIAGMRFLPFGHALCEKMLSPYRGMTGHALLLEVDAAMLALPVAELLRRIDGQLAARVADPQSLQTTRQLAPVPVLGVPGWCDDNIRAEYYDDTGYFRAGRSARKGASSAGINTGINAGLNTGINTGIKAE